jgi:hypothetical protein
MFETGDENIRRAGKRLSRILNFCRIAFRLWLVMKPTELQGPTEYRSALSIILQHLT